MRMVALMMISNAFLLIFAVAFMGCVLATPMVTRIAVWAGAIDRPDHFRRVHKGATLRIMNVDLLGWSLDLSHPALALGGFGYHKALALPSVAVTTFWFLACMNMWNLIDGMDGLASGVGLLVSGTLALVAVYHENVGV